MIDNTCADPGKEQKRREYVAAWKARRYQEDCALVFDHYGRACACCGVTEQLEIDHVNGDGAEHRNEIPGSGSGIHLYLWLSKNNFPPGFQTLCRPCNRAKAGGDRCWLDHSVAARSYQAQMLSRRNAYRIQYNKDRDARTGYRALHLRVRTARGRAADFSCTHADGHCAGSMQWANISGKYQDVEDFMPLCRYHHRCYDRTK